jgi:hypothetical protein
VTASRPPGVPAQHLEAGGRTGREVWGPAGAGRPVTVNPNGTLEVETCTGTWLFQLRRSLFCRVPLGTHREFLPPDAWRPYDRLSLSPDGVVRVILDRDAHSGITGWLHGPDCSRCASLQVELSGAS